MADVKKVIKDLGDTDWGDSDDAQAKAVELLKGLAYSKEPISNIFMKALSDSSTSIAKKVLGGSEEKADDKEESKTESIVTRSNAILEGMDTMEAPMLRQVKVSDVASKASNLL